MTKAPLDPKDPKASHAPASGNKAANNDKAKLAREEHSHFTNRAPKSGQ